MTVLAHAGGAPEAATIGLPLLVVAWFVWRERKNLAALREQEERDKASGVEDDA